MGYLISSTSIIFLLSHFFWDGPSQKFVDFITYFFPDIFPIRGEEESSASTIRKGSHKIARRPDYMTVVQLGKGIELEIVYLETGKPNSSQDKRQRDHKKLIRFSKDSIDTTRKISKLKRVFNLSSKRQILFIFAINIAGNIFTFLQSCSTLVLLCNSESFIIGDVMELYAMRRESGIYKYCLIEKAPIPLHMTSPMPYTRLSIP
jgi:hypothetical protein